MQMIEELRALGGADDPEFFRSVIEQFLEDVPRHVDSIFQAINNHDAEALLKAAHGFKGSCRNIGAKPLADLCLTLEELGRNGILERPSPIFDQLEIEAVRIQSALKAEIE